MITVIWLSSITSHRICYANSTSFRPSLNTLAVPRTFRVAFPDSACIDRLSHVGARAERSQKLGRRLIPAPSSFKGNGWSEQFVLQAAEAILIAYSSPASVAGPFWYLADLLAVSNSVLVCSVSRVRYKTEPRVSRGCRSSVWKHVPQTGMHTGRVSYGRLLTKRRRLRHGSKP